MEFTHFDEQSNVPMIDVGEKVNTKWEAVVGGSILMSSERLGKVVEGTMAKGDVLGITGMAGIMGAKRISDLIPLCHILDLTKFSTDFTIMEENYEIQAPCIARTVGKTGVEMGIPIGVTVALLTIYDMYKAVDRTIELGTIYLGRKFGGKSEDSHNPRTEI